MKHRVISMNLTVLIGLILSSCGGGAAPSAPAKAEAPAKLNGAAVKEADLASITLTPEAENRLGVRVEQAAAGGSSPIRRFTGEVTKPVGSNLVVSSPVAGTLQPAASGSSVLGAPVKQNQPMFVLTPFLPLPLPHDLKATADGDVLQARAKVQAARQRKTRADRMLADQVGTVRAQEDAQLELDLALAAQVAAEARAAEIDKSPRSVTETFVIRAPQDGVIRQIHVVPGQTIAAGAPMFEIEDLSKVWIRVPVYAGEAQTILTKAPATVQALNGAGASWRAQPIDAPPSADSASSTVDLYYALPNEDLRFKPGEKLSVSLPTSGSRTFVEVPWSSIVFDTSGGTWVYESVGDRHYRRRRVNLDHSAGGRAYLTSGISAGTRIVADGAAELWGFEFGTGK